MGRTIYRLASLGMLVAGLVASGPSLAIDGSGAEFGARDPGPCTSIRLDGAPAPGQVVEMLRCTHEVALSTGELWLMQDVQVEVGAAVPYTEVYGTYVMADGDIMSNAYHIRGSFTWAVCTTLADAALYGRAGTNCEEKEVPSAKGVCWKTSFADYRCRFVGPVVKTSGPTAPPQ